MRKIGTPRQVTLPDPLWSWVERYGKAAGVTGWSAAVRAVVEAHRALAESAGTSSPGDTVPSERENTTEEN